MLKKFNRLFEGVMATEGKENPENAVIKEWFIDPVWAFKIRELKTFEDAQRYSNTNWSIAKDKSLFDKHKPLVVVHGKDDSKELYLFGCEHGKIKCYDSTDKEVDIEKDDYLKDRVKDIRDIVPSFKCESVMEESDEDITKELVAVTNDYGTPENPCGLGALGMAIVEMTKKMPPEKFEQFMRIMKKLQERRLRKAQK